MSMSYEVKYSNFVSRNLLQIRGNFQNLKMFFLQTVFVKVLVTLVMRLIKIVDKVGKIIYLQPQIKYYYTHK